MSGNDGMVTVTMAGGGSQVLNEKALAFIASEAGQAARDAAGSGPTLSDMISVAAAEFTGALPMKETAADRAVKDQVFSVAADELRSFIERYETIEAEKALVVAQMKEVMAEAKARGYDTKALRRIIALRKRDANTVAEEDAILELYKSALGMA